ncbi:hypothetical protein FQN53_007727 [Emmonsiellopsis sp. PD_33]|nr:hypothetical protein FQN53_007727 [Emmonsiellopsis sp. PD_33]
MDPFTPKAGYGQDISNSILGTCHIIRLDENRVLKKGHENAQEPATMQFIAENTTIPVPKIYTTKSSSKKNATDFVMEYIPGEPLDKAWKKLTHDQRVSTCSQFVGYLNQLQELPGKRIEAMNGTADGPFDTENGFNDFQAKGADQRPGDSNVIQFPGDNHAIHFAHGDLSPRNVMVDEGGHIIGVVSRILGSCPDALGPAIEEADAAVRGAPLQRPPQHVRHNVGCQLFVKTSDESHHFAHAQGQDNEPRRAIDNGQSAGGIEILTKLKKA